jgi:protein-disulfide isomerase
MKKYGNDLRVVFKHNPLAFHPNAMPAAIASHCAHRQRSFWPLHELLFQNPRALEREKLLEYARQAGNLNFRKWKRCFEKQDTKEEVEADQKMAIGFGARGTPAFFINGRFLSGAQPQSNFERVIDEELEKAKQSGVPRAEYYQKMVEEKGAKEM